MSRFVWMVHITLHMNIFAVFISMKIILYLAKQLTGFIVVTVLFGSQVTYIDHQQCTIQLPACIEQERLRNSCL